MISYEQTKNYLFGRYGHWHSTQDLEDLYHDTWCKFLDGGWPEGIGKFTAFINAFRQLRYDRFVNIPSRNRRKYLSVHNEEGEREDSSELHQELAGLYEGIVSSRTDTNLLTRTKVRLLLTENEYDVLMLHIYKDYNARQIGEVRGSSYQAVSETIKRITKKLITLYS